MSASSLNTVLQLLPPQYSRLESSVLVRLWKASCVRIDEIFASLEALESNSFPQTVTELLSEWESMLGLTPDAMLSNEERSRRILTRAMERRDLRKSTIARIMATYLGYTPTIVERVHDFRCDDADSLTDSTLIWEGQRFHFFVILDEAQVQDEFEFAFAESMLNEIKPAWTRADLAHLGMYCDTPVSLTDRDIFGE